MKAFHSAENTKHYETAVHRKGDGLWLCQRNFSFSLSRSLPLSFSLIEQSTRNEYFLNINMQKRLLRSYVVFRFCYCVVCANSPWTVIITEAKKKKKKNSNEAQGWGTFNVVYDYRHCDVWFFISSHVVPSHFSHHFMFYTVDLRTFTIECNNRKQLYAINR